MTYMCWDPGLLTEDPFDSGPSNLVSTVKNPLAVSDVEVLGNKLC